MKKKLFGKSRSLFLVFLFSVLLASCVNNDEYAVRSPNGKNLVKYALKDRKEISALSGENLNNSKPEIDLEQFKNKILVINIWGQWCAPCRVEMPALEQIYQKNKSKNVAMLGINVRDDKTLASDYIENAGVSYPIIYDKSGKTLNSLKAVPTSTVPTTIILDKNHKAAVVFLRAIKANELQSEIDNLLKENK